MNRLFDDSFRNISEGSGGPMLNPKVDVCPTDDGWEIPLSCRESRKKDIDLRLDGDLLTISGEKRDERKDDQNRLVERSYGCFTRSFQLPFTPDPDRVTGRLRKGVLTIKLPKSAEQDRSKKIEVRGGSGRTIEAGTSGEAAIGKEWVSAQTGSKEGELSKERAARAGRPCLGLG